MPFSADHQRDVMIVGGRSAVFGDPSLAVGVADSVLRDAEHLDTSIARHDEGPRDVFAVLLTCRVGRWMAPGCSPRFGVSAIAFSSTCVFQIWMTAPANPQI
ncbi:hypothetical protein [Amycolatopsis sp. H20-H5]|uniref:hypothetical protein n=1 Tax=Amycolatopsis sp. H20-H5 TaxID=3046309 RepID=UPI002DBA46C4|nr:hypothetical protein [Amycolatopsis sp. H20-H5]MEC3981993.1 hypothetical protein [Amycolatopsis sp. H20-H5]